MWYHASPRSDLHIIGIDPHAPPLISRLVQGFVYFGTMEYLKSQYFIYAPRQIYHIYEVNVDGLYTEQLMEDQIRTPRFVEADRVELIMSVDRT